MTIAQDTQGGFAPRRRACALYRCHSHGYPSLQHGYNHANSLRIESGRDAQSLIATVWAEHKRRVMGPSGVSFIDKAVRGLEIIRSELPTCCHDHAIETAQYD